MSGKNATNPQTQPVILSMEVDDDDEYESEYRVQIGEKVKYLVISPGTFDRDTLSFPLQSLPHLPYDKEWTLAYISRDKASGDLKTSFSDKTLAGVKSQWHHTRVDCLALEKTEQLTAMAFEAVSHSILPIAPPSLSATMIVKIAPRKRAYQLLEGTGLCPRFLGHVHESGRIMGFLLEKIDGRSASLQDLSLCETTLKRLHRLGLIHGDVNRYNFLITKEGVKLIDFERLQENASPTMMAEELENLRTKLVDESGRGGGFIFLGNSN
ncbi:alpha-galactosidase A [Xylona heveae TC161]|uniref:non-specific serine/threonine protein kinase n=1 Tax=Xylona heveae (strain CBS 132557 / TC161) TaxID=1328760 RepID=A0A165AGN0_XYLHT|nr:alpha-galactosidase A [Xylona heveae TC161]KZF20441.1 alpha-galactosidase A [Xylona heveae TC161]